MSGNEERTVRVRDGDMMELQNANERQWKEKRRGRVGDGVGRDCSRLARLP